MARKVPPLPSLVLAAVGLGPAPPRSWLRHVPAGRHGQQDSRRDGRGWHTVLRRLWGAGLIRLLGLLCVGLLRLLVAVVGLLRLLGHIGLMGLGRPLHTRVGGS